MSWLRKAGSSIMRHSVSLANTSTSVLEDRLTGMTTSHSLNRIIDSRAALDSFKTHWCQILDIMSRKVIPPGSSSSSSSQQQLPQSSASVITSDDVTSILNHIDQMVTLLLQESNGMTCNEDGQILISPDSDPHQEKEEGNSLTSAPFMVSPLLDYLLVESILDKLLTWSSNVGEFTNIMKLKQLELYTLLVDQLCHRTALFTRPLVRPMFQLLATCSDCAPVEVEKRFVILLNSLSRCLSQNTDLLDLFFVNKRILPTTTSSSSNGAIASDAEKELTYLSPSINPTSHSSPQLRAKIASIDKPEARFLIFSLLIPFVHREGDVGREARDALLKIMRLSKSYDSIGDYVAHESNFCPVVATGLSGLYSSLPRKIRHEASDDWHQISDEQIDQIPELSQFLASLEFCDTVVREAHPVISKQLIELVHQGFLSSVIGPALHQEVQNVSVHDLEQNTEFANTLEEMIATTAYLELFLRKISHPSLLYVFLKLLCVETFDDQQILLNLISRMSGSSKLSLVTLVLFETMINICCEDVMYELILKYLLQGAYLADCHGKQMFRINDVIRFDEASERFLSLIKFTRRQFLDQSTNPEEGGKPHQNVTAVILSHYMEYLNDANYFVDLFSTRTEKWVGKYDYNAMQSHMNQSNSRSSPDGFTIESPSGSENTCSDSGVFLHLNNHHPPQNPSSSSSQQLNPQSSAHIHVSPVSSNSLSDHNGSQIRANGSISCSEIRSQVPHETASAAATNAASTATTISLPQQQETETTQVCHEIHDQPNHLHLLHNSHPPAPHPHYDSDIMSLELDEVSRMISPFLSTLLSKLRSMLENDVYTNLRVTGMIARLSSYPTQILRSFLLSPILIMDSKVSSLFDIMSSVAAEAEIRSKSIPDFDQRLAKAHSLFIAREEALAHSDSNFIRYFSDHYSDSIHDRRISVESVHSENQNKSRRRSLKDLLFKSRSGSSVTKASESSHSLKPVLECIDNGQAYRFRNKGSTAGSSVDADAISIYERDDRVIAAIVILEEFCQEMSAIAQEHFIHKQIY